MKLIKSILTMAAAMAATVGYAGDSAPFRLDTALLATDSLPVLWDAAWIGGDSNATVVIRDNGVEVRRTTCAGEFTHALAGAGRHELTYTTYICNFPLDEIYTATVFKDWKYDIVDGGAVITDTTLTSGAIEIPDTIDGYPVTGIGSNAFYGCSGLASVTMPNSVTSIGAGAFSGCSGLSNITIPLSVRNIGEGAFSGCSASLFDTTTIPGVKLVDGWAVGYTDSLSGDLDLTGIRGIGDEAFRGCSGLTSVTIPASVTSIGHSAFRDCSGLREVWLPGKFRNGLDWSGCPADMEIFYGKYAEVLYAQLTAAESAETNIVLFATNTCKVTFEWKCSCEPMRKGQMRDYLSFSIDGVQQDAICGEVGWTNCTFFVEGDGEHVLCWTYQKDASGTEGEDCGWVRLVNVAPPVTLSFLPGEATSGTPPASMSFYANEGMVFLPGRGTLERQKHTFIGWSDGESVYAAGASYPCDADVTELTSAWTRKELSAPVIAAPEVFYSTTAAVTITAESGTAIYYTLDGSAPTADSLLYQGAFEIGATTTIRAIAVRDDYFDSPEAMAMVAKDTSVLGVAVNSPELDFSTDAGTGWRFVRGESPDGYALRSGAIGNSSTSRIDVIVVGEGSISFSCKVAGEVLNGNEVYDGLAFLIDGVQQGGLMGNENWTSNTYEIVGEGAHTLSWLYIKDESDEFVMPDDCAWLDEVVWASTPEVPVQSFWHFNVGTEYDTYAEANGNAALGDLSYWTNSLGQAGSGAPGAGDVLVFDDSVRGRLRLNSTAFNSFAGDALQVGTADVGQTLVYSGEQITADGYTLKLHHAYVFCNVNDGRDVSLPIEILAENVNKPAVICVGNRNYVGHTYRFKGPVSGSADAQLRFGPWPNAIGSDKPYCATNTTFELWDISRYNGTITAASAGQNDGASFGTHLRIVGTQTSGAKLNIEDGGSLSATPGDTVTVKELSLAAGSRLWLHKDGEAVHATESENWFIRATDALAVEGPVQVQCAFVVGIGERRIPILAGPSTSTFTEDDFTACDVGTVRNSDMHFEVSTDATTGERVLNLVVTALIDQLSSYAGEGSKTGSSEAHSSLTNAAAWRDGLLPDPANIANGTYLDYHYYTANALRTEYETSTPYVFPAGSLAVDGGTLIVQTHTFEVPELTFRSGSLGVGQKPGTLPHLIVAPHIHLAHGTTTLLSWSGATLVLDGEIDGPGNLDITGHGQTGSPRALYQLSGMNTNFTGSIVVRSAEYRPAYIDYGKGYATFYLDDGRNLGGRKAGFDPRAFTISHLAQVMVTNTVPVTLDDGLNRGVYVWESGRFCVNEASGVLDVRWPVLLSGKMWKEGPGTLILRKGTKHEVEDGGELSDIPRAGSNLFEIVAGTVKIAHADALAGVETTIGAGASIQLVLDPGNADLARYGIRNTAVDAPFTLDASFGGKLPFTVDVSAVAAPAEGVELTNGLFTVNAAAAQTFGDMLPQPGQLWTGVESEIVPLHDDETGMTTFALVSRRAEAPADPIPEIGGDADVDGALAWSADSRLTNYIHTAAEYNAYRGWVVAKGLDHQTVKDSPRAWFSYALDATGLVERVFQDGDVVITAFSPADGGAFVFEVDVKDVEIGSGATSENLARVFGVEGSASLESEAFSYGSVNVSFGVSANGKLSVVVSPKVPSESFFFRVRMRADAGEGDDSGSGPVSPPQQSNPAYCVIDLSGGANASSYPVSYLTEIPSGGWTDEYKTTKLVLRLIEPGTFMMNGSYQVTLTKPFYCGVFEVTQKQYELATGSNPSYYQGDMRPVEQVSWNTIRGDSSTYDWPSSANVDSSTFVGKLQARTGLNFDLPTEAQWEYACRAGTTSKYNNGGDTDNDLRELGRYSGDQSDGKGGYADSHTKVGSYEPNAWGLYDMHGNVCEWCLDWLGSLSSGVSDPQGSSAGSSRVKRGGSWSHDARLCTSSYRNVGSPTNKGSGNGFRLSRTLQ